MKRILIFLIISFFLTNAYSSSKFDKDLKKFSKDNGFIDSKGKIYSENEIKDKKNSILIIYNHGSDNDQKSDKCTNPVNNVPKVIRDLHYENIMWFSTVSILKKVFYGGPLQPLYCRHCFLTKKSLLGK